MVNYYVLLWTHDHASNHSSEKGDFIVVFSAVSIHKSINFNCVVTNLNVNRSV